MKSYLNSKTVLRKIKITGLRKVKFQMMNTCLTYKAAIVQVQTLFQTCPKENCLGKESSDVEEDTGRIGNTL